MNIKAGDLICYNAGGQKRETVGLVLETRDEGPPYSYLRKPALLIQWGCIGNGLLPRTMGPTEWRKSHEIGPGDIVWHEWGRWFEVAK